jgi:hypothetical protein
LTSAITTIDGVNQVFGIAPDRVSNPSLKWETTSQTDIGLEVGILKSKVNLTIDVYKKITSDLLNNLSCPLYTGYTNFWTNLGKIENKGLEIAIDANIIQNKNFYWSLAYNMSFNRGKVLEINENGYLLRNVYYSAGNWNLAKEGEPLGLWYGFNRTDIYQSQSEIDNSGITRIYTFPISQIEPGWKKIQDMNDDGIINDDDKVILGNGNPKFTGGFINNFTYKSFDLSVAFQFSYGADIFNATKVKLLRVRGSQNISKELNNNWLPDLYAINTDGTMGDLVIKGNPSNTYPRTGFHEDNNMYNDNIEDGSFLRLSDVTLGYSLPIKISKIAKINHIRFFLSGKNLWLLTKYTGYDPEVNTSNSSLFAPGMDLGAYPKARVFSIGVNVDF